MIAPTATEAGTTEDQHLNMLHLSKSHHLGRVSCYLKWYASTLHTECNFVLTVELCTVAAGKKVVKQEASNTRDTLATCQDLHSKASKDEQNYYNCPTKLKKKKLETVRKKYEEAKETYQCALDLSGGNHCEVLADLSIGFQSNVRALLAQLLRLQFFFSSFGGAV